MEETKTSEWCYQQRDKNLAEGNFKAADDYLKLAVLWRERENKSDG